MKRKSLLFTLFIAMSAYIWLGHSSGPGAVQNTDRTGSPLSPDYCKACHNGGNFGTEVSILLLGENDTITEYEPAKTYTLQISISAQGAEGFGFQSVALDAANMGAGAFGTPGTGLQITSIGGIDYFEHSSRSSTPTFEIEWTAPESGTGDVTFYAAGNGVNANFQPGGDLADTALLVLTESVSASLADHAASLISLQISPNPVSSWLQARWSPEVNARKVEINDLTGKSYYAQDLRAGDTTSDMLLDNLPAGIYFTRLVTDQGYQAMKFVKL